MEGVVHGQVSPLQVMNKYKSNIKLINIKLFILCRETHDQLLDRVHAEREEELVQVRRRLGMDHS